MGRFLRFVVDLALESRTEEIKESLIGVHVFDRQPGYDPKADAIVRVEARRLRMKLEEYYAGPGAGDRLRIVLPKGGYVPEFTETPALPVARGRSWPLAVGILFAASIIGAAGLYFRSDKPAPPQQPRPLTSMPGIEANPAFSPDGRTIAFVAVGPKGGMDLYLQRVDQENQTLVAATEGEEHGVAWSPDGGSLAFFRHRGDKRMSLLIRRLDSGAERLIGDVTEGTGTLAKLDWSPDGRFLIASDSDNGQPLRLVRFSIAESRREWITAPPVGSLGDSSPSISPDGSQIAFRRAFANDVEKLYLLAGTGERVLTLENESLRGHDWTANGRALIASLKRGSGLRNLWIVPVDGSPARPLMPSSLSAVQPAVSRRGNRLVWVTNLEDMNLWAAPLDGSSPPRPRISSTYFDMAPQYSPDGTHIVFRSNRTGIGALWIASRSGEIERKLIDFNGAQVSAARWSPEGKRIAFESLVAGSSDLYWIDAQAAGASPTPIRKSSSQEVLPWWTRDGRSIYYASDEQDGWQVWKAPVEGGGPAVRLTKRGGFAPAESPDGKWLYYARSAKEPGIFRMPAGGGDEEPVIPTLEGPLWGNWALSGNSVFYLEGTTDPASSERAILKAFDTATRQSRRVFAITHLPARWDTGLAVSPDGREVLFAQLDRSGSDLFLMEGFRP